MQNLSHMAIFSRYKGRISVTFVILLIENILLVAIPFALGLAVNSLAEGTWDGVYIFIGVEIAVLLIGVLRRFYDTRAYGGIYREISNETACRAIEKDDDLSPAIGQAELLKEVVSFFEYELSQGFMSFFSLVGALVMLLILAPKIGIVGTVVSIAIGLVFFFSRHRIRQLNAWINDELEARARVFEKRKAEGLDKHFSTIVKRQISLSDLEARNFGLSYLFVIALIAYALYEAVAVMGADIGSIFAILTYASQFAEGILVLPFLYQQYVRTSEITSRIGKDQAP